MAVSQRVVEDLKAAAGPSRTDHGFMLTDVHANSANGCLFILARMTELSLLTFRVSFLKNKKSEKNFVCIKKNPNHFYETFFKRTAEASEIQKHSEEKFFFCEYPAQSSGAILLLF